MEHEKLLAQIKAFQIYLKNYTEDAKSHPQMQEDEENDQLNAESSSINNELNYIDDRYRQLRQAIDEKYNMFGQITPEFRHNRRAVEHMYREISFILDTIANLDDVETKQPNFKPNNQPFTKDEIEIINNQLDDLQNKLIDILDNQSLLQNKNVLIESVKSEISDLKAEVANPNLGRKDWKNQLINVMITLSFTLSFSQEARTTIYTYFHSLFIYLQQHIFLIKP
jgi:chromosome segregation ATPase